MSKNRLLRLVLAGVILPLVLVRSGSGWGSDGHRIIDRLAAAKLPHDVPEFLRSRAAQDAMEYYGPEPDRWKSGAEPALRDAGSPEHYIDLEWADLIGDRCRGSGMTSCARSRSHRRRIPICR